LLSEGKDSGLTKARAVFTLLFILAKHMGAIMFKNWLMSVLKDFQLYAREDFAGAFLAVVFGLFALFVQIILILASFLLKESVAVSILLIEVCVIAAIVGLKKFTNMEL